MKKIILIHQNKIQHYRVAIYNYISKYLDKYGYQLIVFSQGIEEGNNYNVEFALHVFKLTTINIIRKIIALNPYVIILFANLKNKYLFPVIVLSKWLGVKVIYWGHAKDLEDKNNKIKNYAYHIEHKLVNAILLYADCLKRNVNPKLHYKTFTANNTLNLTNYDNMIVNKDEVLKKHNISTRKNIICLGRIQKRKRIGDLVEAFECLGLSNVGLILAGPDPDGLLSRYHNPKIFKLGPIYDKDAIELLFSCELYCLPGSIGLSIVDAFYCYLPVITENVNHGPEICYFKNGVNGFMVPKGDINALYDRLKQLMINDELREKFSMAARKEFDTRAHIEKMASGFLEAINYVVLPCKATKQNNR